MGKGTAQKTSADSEIQRSLKRSGDIPKHIAIIMDGNGRWAQERGLSRVAGHLEGVNSVRDIVEACGQLDVQCLTLYAFSTENWKRPKNEVSTLMRLLLKALRDEADALHKNNVRLTAMGELSALPQRVQDELHEAMEKTKNNTGLILNLALSYSGRWDILQAVKALSNRVSRGDLPPDEIDDGVFSQYLATQNLPDPDLLIRSSGEFRISNFLLWQIAYTEIFIGHWYWPDFRRQHLYQAIADYQKRERRFGMVSEQIQKQRVQGRQGYARKLLKTITSF